MARKGLLYVACAHMEEKTGVYSDGKYFGPSSGLSGTINKGNSKDFGDSRQTEVDNSPTGGTLNWELNVDDDDMQTYLLGHKVETEEDGAIIFNAEDVAPYVGVGCVGKSEGDYVAKIYMKVQFSEPDDNEVTKKESTEFGHITLPGEIFIKEDGNYKKRKRFKTLAEAKEWVNTILNIGKAQEPAPAQG